MHERLGHCGEAGANVRLVCGDPNPNRLTLTLSLSLSLSLTQTPTPTLTLTLTLSLTPHPPNPNLTLTPTDSMTLTPPPIQARVRRPVRGGRGGGQGGEQGAGRAPRGDASHRCGGGPHARLLAGAPPRAATAAHCTAHRLQEGVNYPTPTLSLSLILA